MRLTDNKAGWSIGLLQINAVKYVQYCNAHPVFLPQKDIRINVRFTFIYKITMGKAYVLVMVSHSFASAWNSARSSDLSLQPHAYWMPTGITQLALPSLFAKPYEMQNIASYPRHFECSWINAYFIILAYLHTRKLSYNLVIVNV